MSFLNTNYSAQVAARLTKQGRNAIATGNFVISYFAIGDSEYNYNGGTQGVLAPLDKDVHVKYPFWYTSGTTIFGTPIQQSTVQTCTNLMSPATDWAMDIVWDNRPIGLTNSDLALTGYTSNKYTGIKEFLGYTSTSGQTTNTGTTIKNTMGDLITIAPEQQKCVAILNYSQNGTSGDPERFFRYDDYLNIDSTFHISGMTISYHRGNAVFSGGTVDKQIVSSVNPRFIINYRDLLDQNNVRVGKIFYNEKLIVFDDEEIVATLDTKSNRSYTLPAPAVNAIASGDPITGLTTGKTMWVTYMLSTGSTGSLPCNYHMNISGTSVLHSVTLKFNSGEFSNLHGNTKFYILAQITNGSVPSPSAWKIMDYTTAAGGSLANLQNGTTFTINNTNFVNGTTFALSNFTDTSNTGGYFGDEKTFQGTIVVTRATDIEEMDYIINLPSDKFLTSQNPTYVSGNPKITEVALLDANKNALVMAKLAAPIDRTGTQVISVSLDF
jgi:hypothetical protein